MQWADAIAVPTRRTLRQFAGLSLIIFGGGALLRVVALKFGWETWFLAALAGWLGVVGLLAPSAIQPIYRGWMMAVFPISWLVSKVLLAVVFFVVFTPVALVFRLVGRDALHLRRRAQASYWTDRPQVDDAGRYLRQF